MYNTSQHKTGGASSRDVIKRCPEEVKREDRGCSMVCRFNDGHDDDNDDDGNGDADDDAHLHVFPPHVLER